MNEYISGLIIESKDNYNQTAYLKRVFFDAWNRDDDNVLDHFNNFYNELSNTVKNQQETNERLRKMALYVICQLTGVLISKGYEETQMNIELLSDYFEIDQALTTEEILEQLKKTCIHIIEYPLFIKKTDNVSSLIKDVLDYIDSHMDEKLSLQLVCKELNYSNSYISHEFTKEMHCTFSEYVQKKKLEKSKELLSLNKSIDEVSNYLCFSSTSHFISFFKKHTNITPKQFVKWLHKI